MRQKRVRRDAIARQANLVKNNAVYVLQINEDGSVDSWVNERSKLEVIAVVGPLHNESYDVSEAVLLEIGMNRTRPYKEVHVPKILRESHDPIAFNFRYDGFEISSAQYRKVAPQIFKYIAERTAIQVATRTSGWMPYKIKAFGVKNSGDKIAKPILSKNKGRLISVDIKYNKLPKVRYSVSFSDPLIISDVYWAELYGNETLTGQMVTMAREMKAMLRKALSSNHITPLTWLRSSHFVAGLMIFDRFALSYDDKVRNRSYLQKILLRDFVGKDNYFYDELAQRLQWDGDETSEEEIRANNCLDDPESRLNGIQIKIWRKFNNLLSFDVYPEPPRNEDDIPF